MIQKQHEVSESGYKLYIIRGLVVLFHMCVKTRNLRFGFSSEKFSSK